jgi:Tfp pilus assembly ATPase PilU
MGAYHLNSCALGELVDLLRAAGAESIRLESGSNPLLMVDGGQFPVQAPALSNATAEAILRSAGNSREIRAFREDGKVEVLHESGDSRFLIRAMMNASTALCVEVHLLRS